MLVASKSLSSRGLVLPLFLACSTLFAQETTPLVVPQGTLLQARLQQQISSRTAVAGEPVKMEALSDLVCGGRIVVRKGAPLTATLTVATKKAKRGPGGRLTLHIADVKMADGEHLALDTTQAESGGGPGPKAYKTLVFASVILLSPAGVTTALLLHGQEVVLPEGTEIAARVGATATLDQAKFDLAPVAEQPATTSQSFGQKSQLVTLQLETSPADAQLWLDGKRQDEPSTKIFIRRGLHKVKVRRDGFKTWQQRVVIEGDPLTLTVALEKK
jgi:hypothetical protein